MPIRARAARTLSITLLLRLLRPGSLTMVRVESRHPRLDFTLLRVLSLPEYMGIFERNGHPRMIWNYACGEIDRRVYRRRPGFIHISVFRTNELPVEAHLQPDRIPAFRLPGIEL